MTVDFERPRSGRTSQMPMVCLQIHLLGPFRLLQNGRPVAGFEQARLQHLLAYLVLHPTVPLSRQQLAFSFWPETTDQQALKNLRTLLTRLRHALPAADRYIAITAQTIQWRPDESVAVDTVEFAACLERATAQETKDYAAAAGALKTAVSVYAGDLLPDCYDDWVLPLREQLSKACGDALERLILLLEDQREYAAALPYARRLLQHDPLHEAAYYHLMRLHLALGDRTEALQVYRACAAMLQQEFGTAPDRATQELYERLRKAEAAAQAPAGPRLSDLTGTETMSGAAGLPLVGRKAEWSRLVAAWHASAAGRPHMVLLSGEAGIGKTRLAEELCSWVARQTGAAAGIMAVAHCYAEGAGAGAAYAPVAEWLRSDAIRPRLHALDEVWLVEIARIVPALLAGHPRVVSPAPLTEAWQRTRLFEALARAVLAGAAHPSGVYAPLLLLFLDDLQWCDQETLDWLGYLLRFAPRAPLLIVATVRKDEIDRLHPLMAFWLALTRSGLLDEILLAPLDAAETRLLATNVAGRDVDAGQASQIYQDTEGNPLFVVETVRAAMSSEETRALQGTSAAARAGSPASLPASEALPNKVRAVIQWRLAQLSPHAQALAQIASVIGRDFSLEVLVQASGQDEANLAASLDELWRRHLVRAKGGSAYDFSHDGIRAVAYDDIGPMSKRTIHLRVARALEELHRSELDGLSDQPTGRPPGQLAAQLAHHYEQAGNAQEAVRFYRRAATVAQDVYANDVAARFYEHLLDRALSAALPAHERCEVMVALAEVWRGTGQWARAEALSREALAEAERLAEPVMVARAQRVLGDVLQLLGYYEAALQCLAQAEQGFLAAGDRRGVVTTLRTTGEIYWRRGAHQQALEALAHQLELATEIDDPRGIAEALEKTGMVLWSQGDWERAAVHCLKAIALATPLEYKPILANASVTLGNIRSGEHRFAEAVQWYQRAAALAREIDDRQGLSWAVSSIAAILAKRGDLQAAGAAYEESLRTAWEIGDRWTACLNIAGLAAVKEGLGRADEAERLYRAAITFGLRLGITGFLAGMLVGLARFLLEHDRAAEARLVYEQALDQVSGVAGERVAGEDIRFDVRVLGIRLRSRLGESSRAEDVAEFQELLRREAAPSRRAALYYELWRLEPQNDAARAAAADLYRAEYARAGTAESRRRCSELTGETLPDPPPLPDVSALVGAQGVGPDRAEVLDLAPLLADLEAPSD